MKFNATFNNISDISWCSVLLVEEIAVPSENHSSENSIPIIVGERISQDLSRAPIREIIAHTTDNGTPRDMSCYDDNNTNKQMLEVNVKVSSDNYKHNEHDKNKSIKNHTFK